MSFRTNDSQQTSLSDSLYGLTPRELKALEKSWAKVFADDVFPMIDEERFRVLYSDKASRPCTPVNVVVGALVLKELFDLSDDEVVENLLLDPRFQLALHTTSYDEQPISDKTLTRFRQRCYNYEELHGVDLYHDCVTDLALHTAKLMKIDGRIRRMDSLMIESNIRSLSRMELLYKCISKLVNYLHNNNHEDLILSMEHYYDPNDFNIVIHQCRSINAKERLGVLLNDADKLLQNCGNSFEDISEYQLLVRCLSEQTVVENGTRRMKTREEGMNSTVMQSPADPDATYRVKAGKAHRGYTANVEESVSVNGSVVTDYAVDTNNTSDSTLLNRRLDSMETSDLEVTLVADGAYSGTENVNKAASKNVRLITTDLTGKDIDPVVGAFVLNKEQTRILRCPAGHEPKSSNYIRQNGICTASFERELCAHCPYQKQCGAKIHKRVANVKVSGKMIIRARQQAEMRSDDFKKYSRFRNGVETIPSILKNVYNINTMHVRGLKKVKFFFGSKVAALNFKKLLNYKRGLGHYAPNPLLEG